MSASQPGSTSPSTPLEVFLSHASADRPYVELVRKQIEALGVRVYLAEHDPRPGTSIAAKVEAALRRADVVVVLITTTSLNSAYVHQEVGLARACRKPIIPIVETSVDKSRLGMLSEVEWLEVDMTQPAEAMASVTASLQPLVLAQVTAVQISTVQVSTTSISIDPATAFLVLGVALLVFLLLAEANGGS